MLAAQGLELSFLDGPTVAFVAVCVVSLLGFLLILAWIQQRDARALAWWGAAYLIGAASLALWAAPTVWLSLPSEVPFAMIFVACGMIWNGVRLFRRRPLKVAASFAGAVIWLSLCQLPGFGPDTTARIVLGGLVVSVYTFFIAYELSRERRKSLYSRTAAIVVPCLHAAIFLLPVAMRSFAPQVIAASWLTVFALETIIYAVGTAFMVVLMVKDYNVDVYRHAAATDFLSGLLNRRAFLEQSLKLCAKQAGGRPVTLLMFDLDHFKSINDNFGHTVGDEVIREFARVLRRSLRTYDIIGRLGGEEFAAIFPEPGDVTVRIAERVRASFEKAGKEIAALPVGATVSIGLAASHELVTNIDALIARADAALYRAKGDGRNRLHIADGEPPRLLDTTRGQASKLSRLARRNAA